MIRAILDILIAVLYLILLIPMELVAWILGKTKGQETKDRFCKALIVFVFRILLFVAGTKVTVKGKENIPEEACLYVGNHSSIFDILVVYGLTHGTTGFVAKKELEKIPLLSSWCKLIHCYFLDRKDPRQGLQVILKCIEEVKNGNSIMIFPEGTRSEGGSENVLEFHEGSMKVAAKSGCPVVPIAIDGARNIWEAHFPWVRSAKVNVTIGKPFVIKELPKEQQKKSGEYARSLIVDMLRESEKNA